MLDFKQYIQLTLKYHDQLNPKIWNDGKINPEVRKHLLLISEKFRIFAEIPKSAIKDVLLTGGNANFLWNEQSDLDVHLLTNFKLVEKCSHDFVYKYMMDKKALWSNAHKELTVKGFTVEIYAQPLSEGLHEHQGVFSLKNNKWLQKPTYEKTVDVEHSSTLQQKVMFMAKQIDDLISSSTTDAKPIEAMKKKIRDMRSKAIKRGGEFAEDNLVTKELRNLGYFKKLSKFLIDLENKELSLEHILQ